MTSLISIKDERCKRKKCVSVDVWDAAWLSLMYLKITLRPLPENSFLLVLDYAKSLWLITAFLIVVSVLCFSNTECYVLVICTVKGMLINNFLLISSLALADDASRPGVDLWLSWLWLSWNLWTLSQDNGYHRSCLPAIWLMASLSSSVAEACYEQDAIIEEGEWALRRLVFLLRSISWS